MYIGVKVGDPATSAAPRKPRSTSCSFASGTEGPEKSSSRTSNASRSRGQTPTPTSIHAQQRPSEAVTTGDPSLHPRTPPRPPPPPPPNHPAPPPSASPSPPTPPSSPSPLAIPTHYLTHHLDPSPTS
ncbi:hypothetical protein CROQUDRAFT_92331 [Cronartium quercuum f. sp. fusiforme G11]|uniref:Uncharacterized protein n=1 Tax=Cronartium quercuum f. sp. fusiforme G11 TaxID=708437 RepID=A0A9P6TBV2_9BASI|nr:hypothetical protein CROQUDRAFT_92331 [Cronartium quercuum f. sp. fusiforme G11]